MNKLFTTRHVPQISHTNRVFFNLSSRLVFAADNHEVKTYPVSIPHYHNRLNVITETTQERCQEEVRSTKEKLEGSHVTEKLHTTAGRWNQNRHLTPQSISTYVTFLHHWTLNRLEVRKRSWKAHTSPIEPSLDSLALKSKPFMLFPSQLVQYNITVPLNKAMTLRIFRCGKAVDQFTLAPAVASNNWLGACTVMSASLEEPTLIWASWFPYSDLQYLQRLLY